jgi:predicted nucleic acid-binding protein
VIGTAYLDASGVMRLLLARRPGHRTALQVWVEADDLVTVTLTHAEVCAALAAARRNRALTEPGLGRVLRSWDALWAQVAPVVLDEALARTAGELARVHALRGADAVHLAAARAAGSDLMLSADRDLCAAARRCGIATIDLHDPA